MSRDYRGIAVIGRAGSGKSTLAAALVKLGAAEHVASFAAELKRDLAGLGVKKDQPFARDLMIAYGQNRRALNPEYWIERLRGALHDDFDGSAIDDVRFPNELAFLRDRGFLIVRLLCSSDKRIERGITAEFAYTADQSETAIENELADITIDTGETSPEMAALAVLAFLEVLA